MAKKAIKKAAPKKKGRKPRKEPVETLHVRIPAKTARRLEKIMKLNRWNKTVAVEEVIEGFDI